MEQDLEKKSAIEEITKTLNEVHFARTIKLNVGGKIYKTTLDTLRKDPDSMLCAMFSGRFELKPDEDDGAYFIDRDGELFRYILNYLRNNELLYPDDKITRRQLLTEAKFYQIQGIVDQLEEEMFPSSVILKDKVDKLSWLPHGAIWSLLFRASDDGKRPADFHRCCDDKGPTVMLIKLGEFILGGYTSKSWQRARPTSLPDSQSFLFMPFRIAGNEQMVKITPKLGAYGGIICRSGRWPSFGSERGCDLEVLQGTDRSRVFLVVFMVMIIHLHELILDTSQTKTSYSLQGQVVLNSLQADNCLNVLSNLRRRKVIKFMEGSSIYVRLSDARRAEELPAPKMKAKQDYLPKERLEKYLNVNPSSSLSSFVPRGMTEDELTMELTDKFTSLTTQLLGTYQKDTS